MIPFEKIPRGLRVPLFFGELAVNGDVVGADTKPPQPNISCVGATNSVILHSAILINTDENTIYPDNEKLIINGIEFYYPPDYIEGTVATPPDFPPPDGYTWNGSVQIKNNSNEDVRLEYLIFPSNQNNLYFVFSDNPTSIQLGTNRNGVCLSAKFSPVISCDGASNQQYFKSIGGFWDMELNGTFHKSSTDLLQNYIAKNLGDILSVGYDGFMYLGNISESNQRIRLIPVKDTIYFEPSENDTFIEQEDGSLTFCLSTQKEPEITCDGATNTADTGGIWGNVTMTVNGTLYEALLPIDGVLEIDNHGSELHNTFKNLSDGNLRVRITSNRLYSSDYGWGENKNPTLGVDFNTGVIEFCLSPFKQIISCDGASSEQNFGRFTGQWDLELNGVYYQSSTQLSFPDYINQYLGDKLRVGIDGITKFFSVTDENIRLRLIPLEEFSTYSNPYGNNTFMSHNDGSLTFCLKRVDETHYLSSEINLNDLILAEDLSFISFE